MGEFLRKICEPLDVFVLARIESILLTTFCANGCEKMRAKINHLFMSFYDMLPSFIRQVDFVTPAVVDTLLSHSGWSPPAPRLQRVN